MSELHKHAASVSPEPLFLQDAEAKLDGELSPWRLLDALTAGARGADHDGLDDAAIGELLRRDFTTTISSIARKDLLLLGPETPLSRLIHALTDQDLQVIPICDDDGRIRGLVSADDLLRGLEQVLAERDAEVDRG